VDDQHALRMHILRAPDSASNAVDARADYPSERRWVEIPAGDGQSLRVHLIDTNLDDSLPVVVMLHGNRRGPTSGATDARAAGRRVGIGRH